MKQTNLYLLFIITILFPFSAYSQKGKPIEENRNSSADENRLVVSGNQIVNQKGDTVILRGFGLGGMLHMENFIDGYPANEET
ncbi:MAG: glycoside hydrolase family 5 protein, partial [Calditrichota bacterium]